MPEISIQSVGSILHIGHDMMAFDALQHSDRKIRFKEIVGLDWRTNFEVFETRIFCRSERGPAQKQDLTP